MLPYFEQQFDLSNKRFVSACDELPLWSSYFGSTLLDKIIFKPNINILDIGSGTGFPLIEIAQRFGNTCFAYGIDPWSRAVERANMKIKEMHLTNIKFIEGKAEELPFDNDFFDLVISNNGINNVADPVTVLKECNRVSKKDAQFIFTVNLPETMHEFYMVFEEVLKDNLLYDEITKLKEHILAKRKPIETNINMIKESGFKLSDIITDKFYMKFINGTAMLNYHFIKYAFLESWKNIVPEKQCGDIFIQIEEKLNKIAFRGKEICLTIPYACFDCRKE
ncbi:MAG: class I SAM-dependent methyltransferase [Ignavibacteriaceae bacterium]